MPVQIVVAALAVAMSLPLLWWSLAGRRPPAPVRAVRAAGSLDGQLDLRSIVLRAPARERAVLPAVRRLGGWARRMTPAGALAKLHHSLQLAGAPMAWPLERVLVLKLVLGAAGGILGALRLSQDRSALSVLLLAVLVAAGYWAPNLVLRSRGRARQKLIRRELADTLDQITISAEAGLGFDAAVARAARTGTGPLAAELRRVLQDIQVGTTRANALKHLEARTDVRELRLFIHAVMQAEGYGIPIAQVLRVQSAVLRDKRREEAEERAQKMSVKMLAPLIVCLLPALFVVLLGPAIIAITHSFLFQR